MEQKQRKRRKIEEVKEVEERERRATSLLRWESEQARHAFRSKLLAEENLTVQAFFERCVEQQWREWEEKGIA